MSIFGSLPLLALVGSASLSVPPGIASPAPTADSAREAAVAARSEIVRTEYGVPHITAEDFEGLGFALAWVQSEDYGDDIARRMVKARGNYASYVGYDSIDGDFSAQPVHRRALATFGELGEDTRQVYTGFAEGVNHYVRLHRSAFPDWMPTDFTGADASALDGQAWSRADAGAFVRRMGRDGRSFRPRGTPEDLADFALDGSNAWSFSGSRTASGRPILLRNPHLSWTAGYYEAHVRIPGKLDFYGDFRAGGPFGIIGGFNRYLGWATTNNYFTGSQVYALEVDPGREDHYMLDGRSHALENRAETVHYRVTDGSMGSETRTTLWTPYGPVILQKEGRIYILKDPRDGEYRRGEQFLRLMQTKNLDEWLDVMHMRAHPTSNFTYADVAGNIMHFYNATLPQLPHPPTGDTAAVAHGKADMWSELVPFDDLPIYINPEGGYTQQSNDTPDYTNLNVPMDRDTMPANLPPPRLRLRSQLAITVIDEASDKLTLDDVIRMKHTHRMLMAERVMDDLIADVAATQPVGDMARALEVWKQWDRTADANSRGGVLFERWAQRYQALAGGAKFYREEWTPDEPMATPGGIGSPDAAVKALIQAVIDMARDGVPLDAKWGDVHRVRRGDVDVPVSGCPATLGCFRALNFERTDDGKLAVNGADGWILAVEFDDVPLAYTVLGYGESNQEGSAHYADQARMFAEERLKKVAFTDADIQRTVVTKYRPGEDARGQVPGGR